MNFALVAEEQLAGSQQVIEDLISRYERIRWDTMDGPSREACARHMLFSDEDARRRANLGHLSARDAFYNSYYWLAIFSKRYQSAVGPDAGIQQQLFKALEGAPADVDWQIIEQLARAAEQVDSQQPANTAFTNNY